MRALEGLVIASAALACAWLVRRLSGISLASALAVLWCLGLALFAGPVPTLATLVLSGAALALGTALSPRESTGLQLTLGLVVLASTIGWLLPLPVHYGAPYLAVALAAIFIRREAIRRSLVTLAAEWSQATTAAPAAAVFGVLALGLASTGTWLPTLQYDDLAYHLRLPWQLQMEGVYSLDPSHQVWALAPWANDVLHAIAQLMGGAEARGPVNLVLLCLAASGLWRLARALEATPRARWLAIALFASIPLTTALLASMHTELATTALAAWLLALVLERRSQDGRGWMHLILLAAGLCALKLTAALLAGTLLLVALVRFRWPAPGRIAALVVLFALVAGSSYTYALAVTGNPFLPLLNGWFHSPYFAPTNLVDTRWATGLNPGIFWDLTFHTPRFNESYPGSAGFALLGLLGAVFLAFLMPRMRLAIGLAVVLLLEPLLALQYLRYAFPGMVLVGAVATFVAIRQRPRLGTILVTAICIGNFAYQGNGHWMLANGAVRMGIGQIGADRALFEALAPERALMRQLRKQGPPPGNVIFLDDANPYFAEAGNYGRNTVWYDPHLKRAALAADRVSDGSAWVALLHEQGTGDVILRPESTPSVRRLALERAGAQRMSVIGPVEWWRLPVGEGEKP